MGLLVFAILRGDGATLTPVFVAKDTARRCDVEDFSEPLINKHGQVLAGALLSMVPAAVLFVGDGRDVIAIAVDGQPAPKGGNYVQCCAKPSR